MRSRETIRARGHPNIKATHRTTIEVTREDYLTERGDCIIGVSADKAARDLSDSFKEIARRHDAVIVVRLLAGDLSEVILAEGHPGLVFGDGKRIIIRKSSFIEPATIGVRANKAAGDLNRDLVEYLRRGGSLTVELAALTLDEVYSEYAGSRAML
ncbi:MAG: DUF371 domain-containing protein [Thermogladius sp.]|nr:DUF371 domain-containing protein [Thermogladius sp.]